MKLDLNIAIPIPEGCQARSDNSTIIIKGPKGEVSRTFRQKTLNIAVQDKNVTISAKNATKREKTLAHTIRAHIKNMFQGTTVPHEYTLKICSGHFPMTVTIKGREITVKNFLGEKVPRVRRLTDGANIKQDGQEISVSSCDIEIAGQVAAQIEKLMVVKDKDRRIFQDGIWITAKPHKQVL